MGESERAGVMRYAAVVIIVSVLCGCASNESQPEKQPGKVTLEFRLAETQPGEDLTAMTMAGSGERFYLHKEVLLSNADIAATSVSKLNGRSAVELVFTESGGEKFAGITRGNLMKRIAILVDGDLVSVPIIRAEISQGRAIIDGGFTEAEAIRLAESILTK